MSKRSTLSAVGGFFNLLGSAIAVSNAIESRKAPNARDLRVLGIEPAQFKNIQL